MAFNIDYSVCIILMAVLTAIYVIVGGYMATAINDFIQGIIMLVGIIVIIVAVLQSKGGLMATYEALSNITDPSVSENTGAFSPLFGAEPLNFIFCSCSNFIWYMGTSTDGTEILRNKR